MNFLSFLFWISLAILFYTYIGYGLLLFIFSQVKRIFFTKPAKSFEEHLPNISLVVPAFNEGDVLKQKIKNSLDLDYPKENLSIIIVTDGSTDNSTSVVEEYPDVIHLHHADRKGKAAALNRAVQVVDSPIVVFSDANTFLNRDCLQIIATHYRDPRIGGVAGEKKVEISGNGTIAFGEGIYWKYEAVMKKLESNFHTVVGAAGELFSMRTELFSPLDENTILDDLILSLDICMKGFKIVYEPEAFATEKASLSIEEERKRKVRIAAGAYQSVAKLGALLNPFRFPLLGFQYISRRLLRWIGSPLSLLCLFISSVFLMNSGPFYFTFFVCEAVFYLLALTGVFSNRLRDSSLIIFIPYYFVFMHTCLVAGFFRFLGRKQQVNWEKSARQI